MHIRLRAISAVLLFLVFGGAVAQPAPGGPPGRAAPADRYVLIHAGTLLAVPGEAPQRDMTVVVKNDRIERIERGRLDAVPEAPGAQVEVVDLSDRFVMPGLMDAHVHLRHEPSFSRRRVERGDRDPPTTAEAAVNGIIYARRNLAAGFTTLRDVGSDADSIFAVRNAIKQGRMIGPRILVSGSSVAVTGGHGDGIAIGHVGDEEERLREATCDGPDECRRAVRYLFKLGADVVKFTSTGGFGSNTELDQQLYADEIEAIVQTAHMLGLKATTHAYTSPAVREAVRAGVDSIEHGFLIDDETLDLMREAGTYLVPTLSASYPPPVFRVPDPESVRLRNEYQAFERAYERGVKIAFGTDAGTFTHGDNAKEFELMIAFGMKPMDALRSATVATADLFGIAEEAGTLEAGKLADLIGIAGDPLENISAMRDVDFVMKSGRIAKRDGRMLEGFSYAPVGPPFENPGGAGALRPR